MSGLITVFWKELADNFSRWRFIILFALVLLAGVFSIFVAAETFMEAVSEPATAYEGPPSRFIFLALFTTSGEALPYSFLDFIVFLVPWVGIALGFDAINSERNSGTLSRLLSQPIFRDAVINGKFLAGVATIAVMLVSIVMLVGGVGLRMIGVPPNAEEIIRLMTFLIVSIIYGAFWLGLAMLFSIFFRRVATSTQPTRGPRCQRMLCARLTSSRLSHNRSCIGQTPTPGKSSVRTLAAQRSRIWWRNRPASPGSPSTSLVARCTTALLSTLGSGVRTSTVVTSKTWSRATSLRSPSMSPPGRCTSQTTRTTGSSAPISMAQMSRTFTHRAHSPTA